MEALMHLRKEARYVQNASKRRGLRINSRRKPWRHHRYKPRRYPRGIRQQGSKGPDCRSGGKTAGSPPAGLSDEPTGGLFKERNRGDAGDIGEHGAQPADGCGRIHPGLSQKKQISLPARTARLDINKIKRAPVVQFTRRRQHSNYGAWFRSQDAHCKTHRRGYLEGRTGAAV